MELHRHEILLLKGGNEGYPILGPGCRMLLKPWNRVVGVHKVAGRIFPDSVKDRVGVFMVYLIPSHMRHFQPGLLGKPHHFSRNEP